MPFSMGEMVIIFLLALVIFGPKKLPEIARQLGKAMNEFKRASNEFKSQLEDEIRQLEVTEAARKELPAAAERVIAPPPEAIAQGAAASGDVASSASTANVSVEAGLGPSPASPEILPPTKPLAQETNA